MKLTHLTDKSLLHDTKALSQQYRYVTAKLLHHLKEIEKRRLFSDLGYASLFDYVVRELGFSEPSAARRIQAARLLHDMPELESKIESGELTVTNLGMVFQAFKNENIIDPNDKIKIISEISHSTKKECEDTLKRFIKPKIELPKETILKISISEVTLKQLQDLKALLAHKKLTQDQLFSLIFKTAYDQLLAKRFKLDSKRQTTTTNPRFVTAQLKKAVFNRDQVCQKCGSNFALQIDHRKPFALGGQTKLENLRLLCRSCNQRARIEARL